MSEFDDIFHQFAAEQRLDFVQYANDLQGIFKHLDICIVRNKIRFLTLKISTRNNTSILSVIKQLSGFERATIDNGMNRQIIMKQYLFILKQYL
jgi:hypothetical protein